MEITYIDNGPPSSIRNFMSEWTKLAQDHTRQVETEHDKLRKEVLAQPIPELTGEQWLHRVADAMKAVLALPFKEGWDSNHPAKRALDVAYIQAHAAGWNITHDMDFGGEPVVLNENGLVEVTFKFDQALYDKQGKE